MVKFGARAHDYGKSAPEELFSRIHADGFGCIQLALKKAVAGVNDVRDVTPEMLDRIGTALRENDLSVGVLGAYVDLALPDEKARLANVAEFTANISFARKLGAACIGTETTSRSNQPGVSREEAFRLLLDSIARIMPAAEREGVTVAIEPVRSHTLNTPELALRMLKTIQSPNLAIIFDPVNVLSEEAVSTQRDLWERCFECFGEKIVAVHMKGVRPGKDGILTSCPFRESVVDYPYLFGRLKQLPQDFSIMREEVRPEHAAEDLAFLQNLLR